MAKDVKNQEQPGNAYGSQQLLDQMFHKAGVSLSKIDRVARLGVADWGTLLAVRMVCPKEDGEDWLIVVSVASSEGRQVAFHAGPDLLSAVTGLANRFQNGSLKWKEDQYG